MKDAGEISYYDLRQPQRPVLEWMLTGAEAALATGHPPKWVVQAWFGEALADIKASLFGQVLRRRATGRPDLRRILRVLNS